jgi:hypothetical protein
MNKDLVKYLIDYGANMNIKNKDGKLPIDLCSGRLMKDIKDILDTRKDKQNKLEYRLLRFKSVVPIKELAEEEPVSAEKEPVSALEEPVSAVVSNALELPNIVEVPSAPRKVFTFGISNIQNGSNNSITEGENIRRWNQLLDSPVMVHQLPINAAIWLGKNTPFIKKDGVQPATEVSMPEVKINAKSTVPEKVGDNIDAYAEEIKKYLNDVQRSDQKVYNTMEYFLHAMHFRFASRDPKLYVKLHGGPSSTFKGKRAEEKDPFSKSYFALLTKESTNLTKNIALILDRTPNLLIDELWENEQIYKQFIRYAIEFRLAHDTLFEHLIDTLRQENYAVEYKGPIQDSDMKYYAEVLNEKLGVQLPNVSRIRKPADQP